MAAPTVVTFFVFDKLKRRTALSPPLNFCHFDFVDMSKSHINLPAHYFIIMELLHTGVRLS